MARALALPVLFVALGCSRAWPGDFWLVLAATPESGVQIAHAEVSPPDALVEGRRESGRVALRLRRDLGSVRVSAPGGCPLVVEVPAGGRIGRRMEPLFALGPTPRVVGPARRFEIRAEPRCDEARRSRVEFRVAGGAPLDDVRVEDGGLRFSATTRGVEVAKGAAWGIVPVSAAERGVTQIDVHIRQPDGFVLERRLEVAALTRSSGLPNVALGHGVLLSRSGFRLTKKPHGSRAELRLLDELAELVPDVRGDFELVDTAGRSLVIQTGRYDEMPLDCGRSDCHAAIAANVRESRMTHSLSNRIAESSPAAPGCLLPCHATGEPGTNDGGFSHAKDELGLLELPAKYEELPRALRRVGGVGCLACHGPAAIPPESARWAVLRSDVCAVCHDAPPRYAHVAAFATTKMGRADPDERTRDLPCARCHTTWGARGEPERRPPPEIGALGIGCVACHDVHPTPVSAAPSPDAAHGLLRRVNVERLLPGAPPSASGPSRVCVACHAPGSEPLPAASAAAVWAGRGGLDPKSGEAFEWQAPHAKDSAGCLRCHASGPKSGVIHHRYVLGGDGDVRGARHAFAAVEHCGPCHDERPERRPELAARARAVLDLLLPLARGRTRSAPMHAESPKTALTGEKARALWNVLFVLEDPAADVHNPAYAEELVSSAEKATGVGTFLNRRLEEAPP